jgi:hypothetical protein
VGLQARADAGNLYIAEEWAELLIEQNRIEEAVSIVRHPSHREPDRPRVRWTATRSRLDVCAPARQTDRRPRSTALTLSIVQDSLEELVSFASDLNGLSAPSNRSEVNDGRSSPPINNIVQT